MSLDSLFAMTTFVIPFKLLGKTRLGDDDVARAMFRDVEAVCSTLGLVVLTDAPGGQGGAVAAALEGVAEGPVVIVNADVPCVTGDELRRLVDAAPAIVAARDGTTNAISLPHPRGFTPRYGHGSAKRFQEDLGAQVLDLPGLVDDVDTWDDLLRVADRVGPQTRRAMKARV
jgi:2-phospho-L-lactate guanylyltransferase (CobY/MobA/RfbA family)